MRAAEQPLKPDGKPRRYTVRARPKLEFSLSLSLSRAQRRRIYSRAAKGARKTL